MTTVRDIMVMPSVIRSSATVQEAIDLMQNEQSRALIVDKCHEDGCYSSITEQDIIRNVIAINCDPRHVRVGSLRQKVCTRIPLSATVQEAAQILADANVCQAPVVENHTLLGVVSTTIVLAQFGYVEPCHEPVQAQQSSLSLRQVLDDKESQMWQAFEDDMRSGCRTTF
ncbi:MAG: CBS domain-containing protein [Cyanobacteria bacterium P01_A01_bin.135]